MSYELFTQAEFGAAHNLREYNGKCERLHGHNWKVDLRVAGGRLSGEGMLLDFVELKRILREILDRFDHRYLNDVPPFDTLNPTSENLARFIADEAAARMPKGVRIVSVTAWESDKCAATYSPRRPE